MMANTGALIGILVIGGAGMAYAISKQKKTTTLPPPGGVHYTPPTNGGSGAGDGGEDTDDDTTTSDDNGTDDTEDDWTGYGDETDYIVPTASYLTECEALWDNDGNRKQNEWRLIMTGEKKHDQAGTADIEGYKFRVYTDKETYFPGETVTILVKKQIFDTTGSDHWQSWINAGTDHGEDLRQRLKVMNTTLDTQLTDTGWGSSDATRTGHNIANLTGLTSDITKDVASSSDVKSKWGINYFQIQLPSTNAEAVGAYSVLFGMDAEHRPSYEKTKDNAFKVAPSECSSPPPADAAAEGVDQMRLEYTPDIHILPITSINSWQTHF
ncbi:MAG: hypothetical protein CL398_00180 [Acidiferrobacteraceae bacterium]|nr:hypothetical protein [Acidiferrobacteraceae bacterium]